MVRVRVRVSVSVRVRKEEWPDERLSLKSTSAKTSGSQSEILDQGSSTRNLALRPQPMNL